MRKLLIAFSVLAIALSLFACGSNKNGQETESPVVSEIESAIESSVESGIESGASESEATFDIPFAGLVLKYPEKWRDAVTLTENGDGSLEFFANGVRLFTLYADGDHSILGTVKGDDEYTVVSVEPGDTVNLEINAEAAIMQEDLNVILSHLISDYDFEAGVALVKEDDSTFAIETPVTTIFYPAKWQDQVTVDVSDTKVSFSADGDSIFDLVFAEGDGFLLGTYAGTPICIVEYDVANETHAAMLEDVNVILQHLMQDDNFEVNVK